MLPSHDAKLFPHRLRLLMQLASTCLEFLFASLRKCDRLLCEPPSRIVALPSSSRHPPRPTQLFTPNIRTSHLPSPISHLLAPFANSNTRSSHTNLHHTHQTSSHENPPLQKPHPRLAASLLRKSSPSNQQHHGSESSGRLPGLPRLSGRLLGWHADAAAYRFRCRLVVVDEYRCHERHGHGQWAGNDG